MPQAYAPSPALRVPSPIPDGHPSAAETWRDTLDALTGAQSVLTGLMVWAPCMYTSGTRSGLAATNTGVYVGPIQKVALADPDGTIRVHTVAATQLNTGTHGTGALIANGNYYVFLYVATNGAAPTFSITATAPAADSIWHPSLTTRRYIGSFTTNAASAPRPFRMYRGRYLYEIDAGDTLADFTLYTGDPGGVQQNLSLQGFVPTPAKRMLLRWVAYSTAAAAVFSVFRGTMPGTAVVTLDAPTAPAAGTSFNTETTEVPVEIDPAVSVSFNAVSVNGNGGGVANVDLYVLGYEETLG